MRDTFTLHPNQVCGGRMFWRGERSTVDSRRELPDVGGFTVAESVRGT